ncbi:DNA repair protein RadC [Clostridium novyi A str. 4570]|uniref:DNA repair protein RadC n=1 Tax=Clostridium novyi A str. 4570 TaxID=1444290 RepID=A0AA89CV58_CLONO|nr:DNA repair protein RadC [Clostridium novyi]KGN03593.1 DNA repair protein RadC [Clostridium novyi A str. 4570]
MFNTLKILDLPENERPRERLIKYGSQALSNSELIAIILGTGGRNENVLSLSSRILKQCEGLNGLLTLTPEEIMTLKGIGSAKAAKIIAVGELAKRFKAYKSGDVYIIKSPGDVAGLVMEEMKYFKEEHLRVIMLNTKNIVISCKDVSIGSLNSAIVHPREVFSEALKKNSASIVICHNHPSGDPTPSSEDINVTKRLKQCGIILGINLLDHLIIGHSNYISLKEKNIL